MTKIKLLTINHIEPVGLMGKDGSDLAKVFSNTYVVQAANQILEQNQAEAAQFLGSLAGQSLAQMFSFVDVKNLDAVLNQLRAFVIQTQDPAND
ncbi:MAG TPA: hypothetical protein DIC32_10215 [Acinetobacter radioresistens]|uniref:Uncharacterized protein n=1 Tax=Acinetobacter radioresistens TaxID=40216 RepID=A0A3D3G1C7_ACIRA|nr:hypothetical protein [Acinetobacter radioresistens]